MVDHHFRELREQCPPPPLFSPETKVRSLPSVMVISRETQTYPLCLSHPRREKPHKGDDVVGAAAGQRTLAPLTHPPLGTVLSHPTHLVDSAVSASPRLCRFRRRVVDAMQKPLVAIVNLV